MTDYINPARKIAYHAAHIAALQEARVMPPINVEIDPSNRCGHGCVSCHFAYTHVRGPLAGKRDKPDNAEPGGDMMDFQLAMSIVNQLYDYGVQSVTWTGGGEPMLHPNFYQIVERTPLLQGVYTQGDNITVAGAAILKHHCSWVYVSLDECTRDDYRNSKGVDRFLEATNGVRKLVGADGDATIGVGFLLHEGNYAQAYDMHALGLELGVDYIQFRPTVYYDIHEPQKRTGNKGWIMKAWDIMKRLQYAEKVQPNAMRFLHLAGWQRGNERGALHGYDTCYWSAMQTVITPNGKVWTCVNKREFSGHCLGDLSQESFADIWARHSVAKVDGSCRVMCRGHEGNVALHGIMARPVHAEFP